MSAIAVCCGFNSYGVSSLECTFVDGRIFLRTHFGGHGELKVELDQRPLRCQTEYKTHLRPFLSSPVGVLFTASVGDGDGDDRRLVLSQLKADDISELRQQLESDLGVAA